jgi:diguanylate cyclase (GGDEF)-like protein
VQPPFADVLVAGQRPPSQPEHSTLGAGEVDTSRLLEILARIDCHLYTGERMPGGSYREIFTGPGLEALLGGDVPDGVEPGAAWEAAIHPDDDRQGACDGGHAIGAPTSVEYRLIGYDGVTRWVLDRMWPRAARADGRLIFDGVVTDITPLRETTEALREALADARAANAQLAQSRADARRQARTDELTSLSNRRHFTAMLQRQLTRAADQQLRVGLLVIDIDLFKGVNDAFGHAAGDELLTDFASRLLSVSRLGDLVARWGGEEFVVLFPEISEYGQLLARGEQIRSRIADQPFVVANESINIQVSIGGALTDQATNTADLLFAAADRAMYLAKQGGRNCVRLAASE